MSYCTNSWIRHSWYICLTNLRLMLSSWMIIPPSPSVLRFMSFYKKKSKQGSTGNHTRSLSHRRPASCQYGKKVYSYLILPIMQRPRFALVKATLIWCSSVTNPSFWLSHPRLGSCSIWESGKDRTSDMITKSFSLPRGEYMGNEEIGEIASCLFLEGILLLHAYTT